MVSQSSLPRPLALMSSRLHKRFDTPLPSFFWMPFAWSLFHIHQHLSISRFHSTFPFFHFMEVSSVFSLPACLHLVAYVVGTTGPWLAHRSPRAFAGRVVTFP
jgi:hypothetical protein